MIFDTHAHYDDEAFDTDREELLGSLKNAGITAVMNVAASLDSCVTTLKLAETYDWMYAAQGIHPRSVWIITGRNLTIPYRRNGLSASWIWREGQSFL